MKVGDKLKVLASESLGTPEAGHIDYPYGLYVLQIEGDVGAMADNRGVNYCGPPCKGIYISWP